MIHPNRQTALTALESNPLSCQRYLSSKGKEKQLIYWNGKISDTSADEKVIWSNKKNEFAK